MSGHTQMMAMQKLQMGLYRAQGQRNLFKDFD